MKKLIFILCAILFVGNCTFVQLHTKAEIDAELKKDNKIICGYLPDLNKARKEYYVIFHKYLNDPDSVDKEELMVKKENFENAKSVLGSALKGYYDKYGKSFNFKVCGKKKLR
jgi:hypothetical protein